MWSVNAPKYTVAEVVSACTTRMRDRALAKRFDDEINDFEEACAELHAALQAGTTYSLKQADFNSAELSVDELEAIYENRMAKGPAPGRRPTDGRVIYDEIMAAPLYRKCPLCLVRPVGEMDHFLPKRKFSLLALCPWNLIGVCGDCNFLKGQKVATSQDDEFFHAYGPDWDGEIWLRGSVSHDEPPLVEFEVSPPQSWSASDASRARAHFERFGLADLYMVSSIALQGSMARYLAELHDNAGWKAVRAHLETMAASYRDVWQNSWEAALFTALAADKNYCKNAYGFGPA